MSAINTFITFCACVTSSFSCLSQVNDSTIIVYLKPSQEIIVDAQQSETVTSPDNLINEFTSFHICLSLTPPGSATGFRLKAGRQVNTFDLFDVELDAQQSVINGFSIEIIDGHFLITSPSFSNLGELHLELLLEENGVYNATPIVYNQSQY